MNDHRHEHDHGSDHHQLRRASGRALRIALAVLGTFFVVELLGGYLTNSLALISDAFHLLSDVAAVGLALFAQWFAAKPPSSSRSYGLRRVEILAALLNGFTLLLVAIYIAVEAYKRVFDPPEVLGWPMVIVAGVGLVAQLITALALGRAKGESLNVRGAYLHAMTDAIQSAGVVASGVVIILTGWYAIDPIVSVLIGVLVAYSGVKIIIEATHVLIEGTPKDVDLDQIARAIQQTPGVVQVTDLHAWSLTTGYNALSAHVRAVPGDGDNSFQCLLKRLTKKLGSHFPLQHITLQIEQDCELCRGRPCGTWLEEESGDGEGK
jgi:cobalt-zinc-cadmium efflux system protein